MTMEGLHLFRVAEMMMSNSMTTDDNGGTPFIFRVAEIMMSNRFWTFQTLKRNAKDNHGMTPSNRNQSRPISSSINYKLPEKFSLSIVYLMIPKPLFLEALLGAKLLQLED